MCNVYPSNYAYMGYSEIHLSESLFTNTSRLQRTSTWHIWFIAERREHEWYIYFSHHETEALSSTTTTTNKKKKMCLWPWTAHWLIDSMGQGLSAATLQFTNCLILLTCMSVCVHVCVTLMCFSVVSVPPHGCYRSTVTLVSLCECFYWSLRKSHWAESYQRYCLSTWLFSDHPQGTKEPHKDTSLTQW